MIKALAFEYPCYLVAGPNNPAVFWQGWPILSHQQRIYRLGWDLQGIPVEVFDALRRMRKSSQLKWFLTTYRHLVLVVSMFEV